MQRGCTPKQLQVAVEDRQKFALRDLIDQSLAGATRKDMGVNVEGDVVKQLDQVRIQKQAGKHGKAGERRHQGRPGTGTTSRTTSATSCSRKEVIRREVGSHITIGRDDAMKYYGSAQKRFS